MESIQASKVFGKERKEPEVQCNIQICSKVKTSHYVSFMQVGEGTHGTPGPATFEKCPQVASSQGPSLMVTQASNAFSRLLYKELRKVNKENLIVSPFSLSTALAMITPGAKGLTLSQVAFILLFFVVVVKTIFLDKRSALSSIYQRHPFRIQVSQITKILVETFLQPLL